MKNEKITKLKEDLKKYKKQLILTASLIPITMLGANSDNIYINTVANEEIKIYDDTIDDLKNLLEKNGVTEPDDIFKNFTYILWNGYLSCNQNFEYNKKVDNVISDKYLGTACLSGQAVCRHIATMLRDLYAAYGYESCTLTCFLDDGKSEEFRKIGNHLITSVLVDDKIYYYDPTNRFNLFKSNEDELTVAGIEDITFELRYIPSIFDYGNNLLDIDCIKNSLPNQRYVEQVEINRDINLKDLISFYENHEDEYIKVYDKTKHIYDDNQVKAFGLVVTIPIVLADGALCYEMILKEQEKNKKEKQLLKK